MEILVFTKAVPATDAKLRLALDGSGIDPAGVGFVLNPYDEIALEQALQLRERHGGRVTVIGYGGPHTVEALRRGLAMGADQAVYIKEGAARVDTYVVARILAATARRAPFDLILAGRQAVDDDQAAVAIMVAEFLGLPHLSAATQLEVTPAERRAQALRPIEGAQERIAFGLPAVVTCQKGLVEPRYPSLPGIMKAKQKPLELLDPAALGLPAEQLQPRFATIKLAPPPQRPAGRILEGEPVAVVDELVRLLRDDLKLI